MEDKIRVITPIWRCKGEYLRQAIDSVRKQTWSDGKIEHVLIWDGWTEDDVKYGFTKKTLKGTINIYLPQRQGVSVARNYGLKARTRDDIDPAFVCYVDSDNWMDKDFIKVMMKNASPWDLHTCAQRVHKFRSDEKHGPYEYTSYVRGGDVPIGYARQLLTHNWIDLGTVFHPFFLDLRFDIRMSRLVDWDLLLQLIEIRGLKLRGNNTVLSHYRMNACEWSISQTANFAKNREILRHKWGGL